MDPESQDARNHNDRDTNTPLTSAGRPGSSAISRYHFHLPVSELRKDPFSPFYRYGENRSLSQHTPQRIPSSESRSRDQDFPPLPGLRGQDPASEPPQRSAVTRNQSDLERPISKLRSDPSSPFYRYGENRSLDQPRPDYRPISELRNDPLSPFYRHGENRSLTTSSSPRRVASTGQTTSSEYPNHGVHGVQVETTKSKNRNKKHKRGTRGLRLSSQPSLDGPTQDISSGTSTSASPPQRSPFDLRADPSSEFYGQDLNTIYKVLRARRQLPESTPPQGPRRENTTAFHTAPGRLKTGEEYLAGAGRGRGRRLGRERPPVWEFCRDAPKHQVGLPSDPRRKASTLVRRDPYRANTNSNSPVAVSNPAPHSSAPPPHSPVTLPPSDTSSGSPAPFPIQSCWATTSNTTLLSNANPSPVAKAQTSAPPPQHRVISTGRVIPPNSSSATFQLRPSNDSFEPVKLSDTELRPWGPYSIDTRPTGHPGHEQGVNLSVPPLDTNFRTNSPIFHGPATTTFAPSTVKLPFTDSFAPIEISDLDSASQRLDSVDSTIRSVWPRRSDMAAGGGFPMQSGDARRHPSASASNHRGGNGGGRFGSGSANVSVAENQRPMSSQLCRNGPQCRKYQEGTCHYNHDFGSMQQQQQQNNGLTVPKKSLNVESPSFTPNFTPKPANALPAMVKGIALSPKSAGAAAFTPKGSVTPAASMVGHSKQASEDFMPQHFFQPQQQQQQQFSEFVPGQSFVPQQQMDSPPQNLHPQINPYADPFMSPQGHMSHHQSIPSLDGTQQINPYGPPAAGVAGQQFYQDNNSYRHPLNYHLYASVGPRRENMQPYQRASADFFIPDNIRDDLHKKSEAALQVFGNSTLPQTVEHFHSLVALDTNPARTTTTFGYPSWIYKATSSKDGHTYALRRIEGFRLTSEQAIRSFQGWKRITCASVVRVHDAFTGRWFGDSSLIVVTDYHPLSRTLGEKYFSTINNTRVGKGAAGGTAGNGPFVQEQDLWNYIVQLAGALKAIHEAGFAAQTVSASKVLLTAKNRLRLNGCGVLDITQYEHRQAGGVGELQRNDLLDLGRLVLSLAARNASALQNVQKSLEFIARAYSERFRACLVWLLNPPANDDLVSPTTTSEGTATVSDYNVGTLLTNISDKVISVLDSTLHYEDEMTNNLMRELENGRLIRLLTKMNVVLERPDISLTPTGSATNSSSANQPSNAWSETGERYYLKLFRDYVFHQVDHEGRPVLNLGHIITCLNKMDAGTEEMVQLMSRDEQNIMVVSYREVKRGFESAWAEISKAAAAGRR
ncbi:PAB-dependent poly(A)-specific ribonuclease subunit 3 [Elasticomyces elasticus]|nr:PAB-dependent poly(A)-specific ribonuclease subunit 3 [Elasticomyces elasticus]